MFRRCDLDFQKSARFFSMDGLCCLPIFPCPKKRTPGAVFLHRVRSEFCCFLFSHCMVFFKHFQSSQSETMVDPIGEGTRSAVQSGFLKVTSWGIDSGFFFRVFLLSSELDHFSVGRDLLRMLRVSCFYFVSLPCPTSVIR